MVWKGNMEFKTRHNGTDGACMRMRRPGHPDHNKLRKRCFETSGPMIEPPRAAKVALYHYATKSLADFTSKMSRGSGMSAATKGMEYFDQIARCGLGLPCQCTRMHVCQWQVCVSALLGAAWTPVEGQRVLACGHCFLMLLAFAAAPRAGSVCCLLCTPLVSVQ